MRDVAANRMERLPHSKDIDFTDWDFFGSCDESDKLISQGLSIKVAQTLEEVFEEHPPKLSFGCAWGPKKDGAGGPCPKDPATLYVELPLTGEEYDAVYYSVSLEGVIDDLIELHDEGGMLTPATGKIKDKDGRRTCHKISVRLRELADKLDAACTEENGK